VAGRSHPIQRAETDQSVTTAHVEHRVTILNGGKGKDAIAQSMELLTKQALGDGGAEGEVELALALLRDRAAGLEDPRERQRALGMLARRGFDAEVAYEAIRRARSD